MSPITSGSRELPVSLRLYPFGEDFLRCSSLEDRGNGPSTKITTGQVRCPRLLRRCVLQSFGYLQFRAIDLSLSTLRFVLPPVELTASYLIRRTTSSSNSVVRPFVKKKKRASLFQELNARFHSCLDGCRWGSLTMEKFSISAAAVQRVDLSAVLSSGQGRPRISSPVRVQWDQRRSRETRRALVRETSPSGC